MCPLLLLAVDFSKNDFELLKSINHHFICITCNFSSIRLYRLFCNSQNEWCNACHPGNELMDSCTSSSFSRFSVSEPWWTYSKITSAFFMIGQTAYSDSKPYSLAMDHLDGGYSFQSLWLISALWVSYNRFPFPFLDLSYTGKYVPIRRMWLTY